MNTLDNKYKRLKVFSFGVIVLLVGLLLFESMNSNNLKVQNPQKELKHENNIAIIDEQKSSISTLLEDGRYRCCMKEPCSRCFAKKENHAKEGVCDCLDDIMEGKHPCGECLGEILEGEGNPLIAKYFATSIAEKLGEEHLGSIRQIISEQYGISESEQL